jgi:hypothetical protein
MESVPELIRLIKMLMSPVTEYTYLLAKWAVKCVSDCRCEGSDGSEDCAWEGVLPGNELRAMMAGQSTARSKSQDISQFEY